jgi:large subunit ribosomal protein L17
MRHRKKGKKLGRTSSHRKRTLQALSSALIENKRIRTTVSKAKALRPFVEPLITRAKEDTEHNRRQVFRHLQNKDAVRELFDEVGDQVGTRPGGYTRIIRLGHRSGDGTEMAMVELVDYNDVKPEGSSSSKSRTRRGSGKGRRSSSDSSDGGQDAGDDAPSPEESSDEPDSQPAAA